MARKTLLYTAVIAAAFWWPSSGQCQCLERVVDGAAVTIGDINKALNCWSAINNKLQRTLAESLSAREEMSDQLIITKAVMDQERSMKAATVQELSKLKQDHEQLELQARKSKDDLVSAQKDLARFKSMYEQSRIDVDAIKLSLERANLFFSGTKFTIKEQVNADKQPYIKTFKSDARFVNGVIEISDLSIVVDAADNRMPELKTNKLKMRFMIIGYSNMKAKWISGVSVDHCCWESGLGMIDLTTKADSTIALSIPEGLRLDEVALGLALLPEIQVGDYTIAILDPILGFVSPSR